MLLIVFGAGASHDSFPDNTPAQSQREGQRGGPIWPGFAKYRPPLTHELMTPGFLRELREAKPQIVQGFPPYEAIQPILPELNRLPDGVSLEMRLEELRRESSTSADLAAQLIALRFYLQAALCEVTKAWLNVTTGTTNYVTLLNRIRRYQGGQPILVVTFNYDTLLEHALARLGYPLQDIGAYVHGDQFKVFKLHGSTNWAHRVTVDQDLRRLDNRERLRALFLPNLRLEDAFRLVDVDCLSWPIINEAGIAEIPAIAVPFIDKNPRECPSAHVELLGELIPRTTRLLIIGWRGMEAHFLEMLRRAPEGVDGRVVSSGRDGAEKVAHGLKTAGVRGTLTPLTGGFTDIATGDELMAFLRGSSV